MNNDAWWAVTTPVEWWAVEFWGEIGVFSAWGCYDVWGDPRTNDGVALPRNWEYPM